eukprot:1554629-Heterocapsa_arctica.AAC.1
MAAQQLRGLVPTDGTLAGWADVEAARAWAALPLPALVAVLTQIGDPELDNLALLAALGADVLRDALRLARIAA